jgi:hypothetical protein
MDDKDIIDTIVITGADCEDVLDTTMNSYTFSSGATGALGSYYVSTGAGANGTWAPNPYVFTTNNTSVGNISGSGLHVSTDAIFDGDIKWKGRSLGDTLSTIEKRLAILTPDPAKLEHFEALRKAYDHYKTLEALCEIPEKKDDGS